MSHLRAPATGGSIDGPLSPDLACAPERACWGAIIRYSSRVLPGNDVDVCFVSDDEIMTVRGNVHTEPRRGILDFRVGARCKFRPEGSLGIAGL